MKIHLAKYEPNRQGGGWTFQRNFYKAMTDKGIELTNQEQADIYFITSASMVTRDEVREARDQGKKIVLRCDNIIRNSRNRNTGMSRMRDFAEWADLVIYQSEFAKGLLDKFLQPKKSVVILNSTDESIFYGEPKPLQGRYLYSKYSSDETKNWEMARLKFQELNDPKSLTIVGRFDETLREYNYDFYQGEEVYEKGLITDANTLADIYRNHDCLLYSYFNDACSNTLIEALSCGLEVIDCYGMTQTGGAPEILAKFREIGKNYFFLERMADDYIAALGAL